MDTKIHLGMKAILLFVILTIICNCVFSQKNTSPSIKVGGSFDNHGSIQINNGNNYYITNNQSTSTGKYSVIKDQCFNNVKSEFNNKSNRDKFKILLLPFYAPKQSENINWNYILKRKLEGTEVGEYLDCQIYQCVDSSRGFYPKEIFEIKKATQADLVIYGAYDCNSASSKVCVNWLGDSMRTSFFLNYDSVSPSHKMPLKNDDLNFQKIDITTPSQGTIKSPIDFVVNLVTALAFKDRYTREFFLNRALAKASNIEDSIICMKQLIPFETQCYCDSSRLTYIQILLQRDPENQLYQFIEASDLFFRGRSIEAQKVLWRIENKGLDTSLIPRTTYSCLVTTIAMIRGNSETYNEALNSNGFNFQLLNNVLMYYLGMDNNDSVIYYCTKIMNEANAENRKVKPFVPHADMKTFRDTLVTVDTFAFEYEFCDTTGFNLLGSYTSITTNTHCTTWNSQSDTFSLKYDFMPFLFIRGLAYRKKDLPYEAVKDFGKLIAFRPDYVDMKMGALEDPYFLRSMINRYLYYREHQGNVIFWNSIFKDMRESIKVISNLNGVCQVYKDYALARRYTVFASLWNAIDYKDSVNFYMKKALGLLSDSLGRFQRADFLLENPIQPNIQLANDEYAIGLAQCSITNEYALGNIYYNYAYTQWALKNFERARQLLSKSKSYSNQIINKPDCFILDDKIDWLEGYLPFPEAKIIDH